MNNKIFTKIVAIALLILLSSFNTSDQSGKAGGNNSKMKIEFYLPLGGNAFSSTPFAKVKTITNNEYALTLEWRYYNDGKAWLGKVVHKKKIILKDTIV